MTAPGRRTLTARRPGLRRARRRPRALPVLRGLRRDHRAHRDAAAAWRVGPHRDRRVRAPPRSWSIVQLAGRTRWPRLAGTGGARHPHRADLGRHLPAPAGGRGGAAGRRAHRPRPGGGPGRRARRGPAAAHRHAVPGPGRDRRPPAGRTAARLPAVPAGHGALRAAAGRSPVPTGGRTPGCGSRWRRRPRSAAPWSCCGGPASPRRPLVRAAQAATVRAGLRADPRRRRRRPARARAVPARPRAARRPAGSAGPASRSASPGR